MTKRMKAVVRFFPFILMKMASTRQGRQNVVMFGSTVLRSEALMFMDAATLITSAWMPNGSKNPEIVPVRKSAGSPGFEEKCTELENSVRRLWISAKIIPAAVAVVRTTAARTAPLMRKGRLSPAAALLNDDDGIDPTISALEKPDAGAIMVKLPQRSPDAERITPYTATVARGRYFCSELGTVSTARTAKRSGSP